MKNLFFLTIVLRLAQQTIDAQKSISKREYYDYLETKHRRTWSELGDGNYQGVVFKA